MTVMGGKILKLKMSILKKKSIQQLQWN